MCGGVCIRSFRSLYVDQPSFIEECTKGFRNEIVLSTKGNTGFSIGMAITNKLSLFDAEPNKL
ncbi:hypothetical protein A9Q99_00120 [Gammaproteobacteria bacterium 45_16_T64]|nr:hypothetical protein A9Q99_00120 [Gammaproteobacteria bacterium 45_16_T64]